MNEQELTNQFRAIIQRLLNSNGDVVNDMNNIIQRTSDEKLAANARKIMNVIIYGFAPNTEAGEIIRLTQAKRFDLLTSKN